MRVRYVVLYVTDVEACRRFWVEQVGMVERSRTEVGELSVVQVGFTDQDFALELVPLALMTDNPDGLDLATPSMALQVDDLEAARAQLLDRGVPVTEIGDHGGALSFGFSDPEDHWFAITT
jgi:catechol 2,3-dioxygenase-like lactoylglutathione lyase family enzyme